MRDMRVSVHSCESVYLVPSSGHRIYLRYLSIIASKQASIGKRNDKNNLSITTQFPNHDAVLFFKNLIPTSLTHGNSVPKSHNF